MGSSLNQIPALPHLQENLHDPATLLDNIKACGKQKDLQKGRKIHAHLLLQQDLLSKDIYIRNALLTMYARCGAFEEAQKLFNERPMQNIVSWNALISGYAQQGLPDEALNCFKHMQEEGISPNSVTFICVLKACSATQNLELGEEICAEVQKQGLLEKDPVLGTALVDMYAKCGMLDKAQGVFDLLQVRDVVCWTALITGYALHGHGIEALKLLRQMRKERVSPNVVTFICILKACSSIGSLSMGETIHAEVAKKGLLRKNIVLGTALVDMYVKCGMLIKAQEVFHMLPRRDVVSWNVLLAGYTQHGLNEEALEFFEEMQDEGISPSAVTFMYILRSCSSLGSLEVGEEIHKRAEKRGLLEKSMALGNTLVDMYAKCGELKKAQHVFDKLIVKDVVSWSALMTGYAQLGQAKMVLDIFNKMMREGIEPDVVTFVLLLTACCHGGLVEEGQRVFDDMGLVYSLTPTTEHYTCMVDLFSRARRFDKAIIVIKKVVQSEQLPLWLALLSSCRECANVELGKWAFEQSLELDETCSAIYVCMGNIYAAAGMLAEAKKIKSWRAKNKETSKMPGCYWTDANGNVHSFTLGNKNHPQLAPIYAKIEDICKKLSLEGCSRQSLQTFFDGKNEDGCGHSEKLTLAFALINTPQGMPVHITKKTRFSRDCHLATLLISKVERCKIHVKDVNSIHMFENGKCTCENYCCQ